MEEYFNFLKNKQRRISETGFEVSEKQLNPILFDFQKWIVKVALRKGRYAVFSGCGTGKSFMQIEWAHHVVKHTNKPVLILAPLAVTGQTIQEGEKLGIKVSKHIGQSEPEIYIINYEQIENIDCSIFGGIVLDESGILKNYEGKIKNKIIESFFDCQFKLACTATPSPNDPMELGNHSEFLNIMSRNEMLAMYFVHDAGETQKWRLKGHCEQQFWDFVSTWSIMFERPSDIGFNAEGYDLPPLNLIEKQIITPKKNNGSLFNDTAVSATDFNAELRLTKVERLSEVIGIVNNSEERFIIWVKQNEEADYLKKLIPDAVEVRGNDTTDYKEEKLLGFADNKFRVLISKTKIAGWGMNYQSCHNQIFASLDFSFESLFQGIRRSYRFGQTHVVNIWLITTDTMTNVIQSIKKKEQQFEDMQKAMTASVNKNLTSKNKVMIKRNFEEYKTDNVTLQLGDAIQLIQDVPNESVGLSVFSPPFASLYTYSSEIEDMGNSKDYNEFLFAFNFLVKELYRVLWSGRNVAVHCMDLPIQKGKEGFIGLRDFSGMILSAFEEAGFIYASRVTIWKNPVTEMQRTKALGLLHKQLKKDATMSRVGIPDYVLIFRKDGERINPVHVNIPVDLWQKWASPVWMDIDYGDTLNREEAREEKDERHICPLQLPTIERLIALYSNEGDMVLSPFAGIGSELYQALKMKRKAKGFELKKSYYDAAVNNLMIIEENKNQLIMEMV